MHAITGFPRFHGQKISGPSKSFSKTFSDPATFKNKDKRGMYGMPNIFKFILIVFK